MKDDKYILFKRTEFDAFVDTHEEVFQAAEPWVFPNALDDAVVIRTGDIYASTVLWGYIHAAQTAIELLRSVVASSGENDFHLAGIIQRQEEIRDYFAERAREADDAQKKLPD
jgi:hypothetical protein